MRSIPRIGKHHHLGTYLPAAVQFHRSLDRCLRGVRYFIRRWNRGNPAGTRALAVVQNHGTCLRWYHPVGMARRRSRSTHGRVGSRLRIQFRPRCRSCGRSTRGEAYDCNSLTWTIFWREIPDNRVGWRTRESSGGIKEFGSFSRLTMKCRDFSTPSRPASHPVSSLFFHSIHSGNRHPGPRESAMSCVGRFSFCPAPFAGV